MTVTVNQIERRALALRDDRLEATLVYRVADDAGVVSNERLALVQPNVPRLFDRHPDYPDMAATDYEVRPVSGSGDNYTYDVEWTYTKFQGGVTPDIPDEEPGPEDVGFVDFQVTTEAEFLDVYRTDTATYSITRPRPGSEPWTTSSQEDIGGEPVDSIGEPVSSIPYPRQTLVVEQIVERRAPNFTLYRELVGKRNSKRIFGADVGTLLYTGSDSERLEKNKYRVVHTFAWDEWFHCRQAPLLDYDGKPALNQASVGSISTNGQVAATIYWVQPFPDLADFDRLKIRDVPGDL